LPAIAYDILFQAIAETLQTIGKRSIMDVLILSR